MIVKVCGLRDVVNISEVVAAGADWIGIIFYPKSPRYVEMVSTGAGIIPDQAATDTITMAKEVKRVGVFVDDMAQNIITRVVNYRLDMVQLHGHEGATLIRNLRATIDPDIHPDIKFIKAISITSVSDIEQCRQYEGVVDYFLFDTKCATVGGSGCQFDWTVLDAYQGQTPFLLSGGIRPEDVDAVKNIKHPRMIGVDLNSCFETAPAVKDAAKIKTFINELKPRNNEQDKQTICRTR